MPTVIDELIVRLGLDPSAFTKGQKDAAGAFVKTKEHAEKTAKDIEFANKRVGESFRSLAGLAIEFFAVVAAGKGIKEFISDIQRTDVAIGRLAMTTGTSVKGISTWGNAVQEMGYGADDALASISSLQNKIQDFVSFGKGGEDFVPIFARYGISARDAAGHARDALDMFKDLNAKFNALGIGIPEREAVGRQLNLDAGTRALLDLSTEEFNRRISKASPDAITEKSTDAARRLAEQIGELQVKTKALGTALVTDLASPMGNIIDDMSTWIDKNKDWIEQDFAGAAKVLGNNVHGVELAFAALITLLTGKTFLKALAGVRMLAGAFGPITWGVSALLAFDAWRGSAMPGDGLKKAAGMTKPGPNDKTVEFGSPEWNKLQDQGSLFNWQNWKDLIWGKKADADLTHDGRPISKSNPLPVQDTSINNAGDLKPPTETQNKGFFGGLWDGIKGAFTSTNPRTSSSTAPTNPGGRFHTGTASPAPSTPSNTPRGQVVAGVSDAWRAAGMSEEGVAGVLGNIEQESNFDPNLRHPDQPAFGGEAHYAHGLYQEGGDEWNNYAAWLAKNHPGESWQNPAMQNEFAAWNLKTHYPKVWAAMKAAKSPEEAAVIYRKGYLKPNPAMANDPHRTSAAARFYQHPVTAKNGTKDDGLSSLRGTGIFGADASAALARASQRAPLPTDLNFGAAAAAMNRMAMNSSVSNSSQTHIGEVNVHTQATDARGIANDLKPALQNSFDAASANYGIA